MFREPSFIAGGVALTVGVSGKGLANIGNGEKATDPATTLLRHGNTAGSCSDARCDGLPADLQGASAPALQGRGTPTAPRR